MSPDGTPRNGVANGTLQHVSDGAIVVGKPVEGHAVDLAAAQAVLTVAGNSSGGQMQVLESFLTPYKEKCSQYITVIRPWREFVVLSKPGLGDVKPRLEANLSHYRTNYGCGFLVLFAIGAVQNTWCIMFICVLAAIWAAFLKKEEGDDVTLTIAGYTLDRPRRKMALAVLSAVAFLIFTGQVLFQAAAICAALVLAHGALHPVPDALEAVPAEDVEAARLSPSVMGAPTFGGAPCGDAPL